MAENEEIKNRSFLPQPLKIFALEALLFFLTLGLGIVSAVQITKIVTVKVERISLEPTSLWQFLLSFSFALLIIFLIIRFVKVRPRTGILFKIFFVLPVFLGGMLFFSLWIGDIFALILISALIIYWIKRPNVLVHNFLFISGIIGMGSVFGLRLDPLLVVLLLVIFSIYDIIAVYKTKHMVKMAKAMVEAGVVPGIILPSTVSEFQAPLKNIKIGGKFLILGGGDIVFPLLLVASVVPYGILNSLIVTIFATIGLLVSFLLFMSQETRKPIPALPPIATFSIIGYLLTQIL